MNPGDQVDRGQSGRRAARSQARAALARPRKYDPGHVSTALWARARLRFGPGVVPLAPFPLMPINIPPGASVGRYPENRVVFITLLLGIGVIVSFFF